jgi:hypothetical protein
MKSVFWTLLLGLATVSLSCYTDYAVMYQEEPEPIIIVKEIPYYIEVEVPVGTPTEEVEIWVDSFTQTNSVNGVDILWVIDTSGSMNAHDAQLLLGIDTMLNALPVSGWRLVMIPADHRLAETESQFPLVPGDGIAEAEDMYSLMQRGSREEGFDSVYAYIVNNPYAATWMRPDAALLVVFVSDEDEQSSNYLPGSLEFISWYTSQRLGNVFVSSIINVDLSYSVCLVPPPVSEIGMEYMTATSYFSGVIVDICTEDWSPGVADAAVQIEPIEKIVLTKTPVTETIRVFIDTQPSSEWYYVESENAVYFTVVPSGGSLVEVGYVVFEEASDTADTGP